MSDLKSLGYIIISTKEIDRWRRFAFGVLGFAEGKGTDPSALYLRMDERAARIVVVPGETDRVLTISLHESGRSLFPGTKQYEGDMRTPEGVYAIIKKYPSERFTYFLRLNYPNKVDRNRYTDLLDDDVVPVVEGRRRSAGGAIGIHGTDRPRFNNWDIDWTTGCISIDNQAIEELNNTLPIGTVVIIKP